MNKERKFHFCRLVGEMVEDQYDAEGGADLCYNMLESGELTINESLKEAAKIVAQRLVQP